MKVLFRTGIARSLTPAHPRGRYQTALWPSGRAAQMALAWAEGHKDGDVVGSSRIAEPPGGVPSPGDFFGRAVCREGIARDPWREANDAREAVKCERA